MSFKKIFLIAIIICISGSSDTENIIDIIKADDEYSFREAIKLQNKDGGIIYINTTVINIKTDSAIELRGDLPGKIIGIQQQNNQYPIINFETARNNGSFKSLYLYGSNKLLQYLIIENSGTHGIQVYGKNHVLDHIISRYNQYAGIYIDNLANTNTFNYIYSYRNCDIKGNGINGDGFFINGAMNNYFNYCFSWDNSNNGFGVSKLELQNSIMSYSNCACWNNGNADVFSGKYDYKNGAPLDKKMLTIQQLIKSDVNYEKNYIKKKFNIDNSLIDGKEAINWISLTNSRTKGNGFQFGFALSVDPLTIKRVCEYSVAFDHKSIGFDNNYSKKYSGHFSNCVSFNNKINYKLPYNFEKWSNNWSWGATEADQSDMNQNLEKPNSEFSQEMFYTIRNQIVDAVNANTFEDSFNFNRVILGLY
jgi:hypothetical protein